MLVLNNHVLGSDEKHPFDSLASPWDPERTLIRQNGDSAEREAPVRSSRSSGAVFPSGDAPTEVREVPNRRHCLALRRTSTTLRLISVPFPEPAGLLL